MNFRCDNCNKNIEKYSKIFCAFDTFSCSETCRNKIIEYNMKIDPKMSKPHLWNKNIKSYNDDFKYKKILQYSIPKITSLSNMISNFGIN